MLFEFFGRELLLGVFPDFGAGGGVLGEVAAGAAAGAVGEEAGVVLAAVVGEAGADGLVAVCVGVALDGEDEAFGGAVGVEVGKGIGAGWGGWCCSVGGSGGWVVGQG